MLMKIEVKFTSIPFLMSSLERGKKNYQDRTIEFDPGSD